MTPELQTEVRSFWSDRRMHWEVRMNRSGGFVPQDEWDSLYQTEDKRDADLFRAQILVFEHIVRGVYQGG